MGAVITLPTSLFVCTCCGVSSLSSRALSGTSTPLACDLIRARFEHTTMSSPTPRRHRNARENHDGLSMAPIEQRWTRYPASAPLKGHLGYKGTSHSHLHHTLPLPAPQIPLSSICTSSPRSNPPLRPTPANMIALATAPRPDAKVKPNAVSISLPRTLRASSFRKPKTNRGTSVTGGTDSIVPSSITGHPVCRSVSCASQHVDECKRQDPIHHNSPLAQK